MLRTTSSYLAHATTFTHGCSLTLQPALPKSLPPLHITILATGTAAVQDIPSRPPEGGPCPPHVPSHPRDLPQLMVWDGKGLIRCGKEGGLLRLLHCREWWCVHWTEHYEPLPQCQQAETNHQRNKHKHYNQVVITHTQAVSLPILRPCDGSTEYHPPIAPGVS